MRGRTPGAAAAADFTSGLILGLTHESDSLSWTELTTGTPAALRRSDHAVRAAQEFATLVGCDRALVLSSTLHAFTDLFGEIWKPPGTIFHDDAVYPIACWGMERAERRSARVVSFRHLDPHDLQRLLGDMAPAVNPPWVVTDGFCAGCARPAPLDAYVALLRPSGGRLVVDDAQAIGLFGRPDGGQDRAVAAPYGRGGAGSIARLRPPAGANVVLVASLAKAFGAPLTMIAGPRAFVDTFAASSETLVHCSPPPVPTLVAARRALALSATVGDALRALLATRVRRLRHELQARGVTVRGGLFPVQRVPMPDGRTAIALQEALERRGVRAVVRRSRCNDEVSLTFIVTARHSEQELCNAAATLAAAAGRCRRSITPVHSNLEA